MLRRTLHSDESELFNRVLSGISGIGVEIGSLDGYSALVILKASGLVLTCIDPFVPDSMDPETRGEEDNFLNNLLGWFDRMNLVIGYSQEVVKEWNQELDFLFIDGDHVLESVQRDYIQWVPFLKKGGLLAMHDSRMSRGSIPYWPGPSRIADQYVYGRSDFWEIIGEAQTLTIAKKK